MEGGLKEALSGILRGGGRIDVVGSCGLVIEGGLVDVVVT